jgi:hypothetical protein
MSWYNPRRTKKHTPVPHGFPLVVEYGLLENHLFIDVFAIQMPIKKRDLPAIV